MDSTAIFVFLNPHPTGILCILTYSYHKKNNWFARKDTIPMDPLSHLK